MGKKIYIDMKIKRNSSDITCTSRTTGITIMFSRDLANLANTSLRNSEIDSVVCLDNIDTWLTDLTQIDNRSARRSTLEQKIEAINHAIQQSYHILETT